MILRYLILKHKKKEKIICVNFCKERNFYFEKTLSFNMIINKLYYLI